MTLKAKLGWVIGAMLGAAGLANLALGQVPALFYSPLTGTEQFNVSVPNTNGLVTAPQTLTVTAATIKTFANNGSGVAAVVNNTGTAYTFNGTAAAGTGAAPDAGDFITFSNTSSIAITLPQAGTTGFAKNVCWQVQNLNTGVATITPTTSTISGQSTLALDQYRGGVICSDGTNYQVQSGDAGLLLNPVAIAEGGTGAATASAARTALGLGTSATINTGTSGATIPLNNGNNTLSGTLALSGTTSVTGLFNTAGQGLPTIASGACGATTNGAVVAGSTNQSGNITIGSASTSTCTVAFSGTLGTAPLACVIQPTNSAAATTGTTAAYVSSITTAHFVITGTLANANYAFHCL